MKNIHILPTLQPSRLWFHKLNRNLGFSDLPMEYNGSGTWVEGRNIYITNDEEIKEGDWFTDSNNSLKKSYKLSHVQFANPKKIILTTDQDLIKDGVQAIDDEFLEWFVKNPSCEEVEFVKEGILYDYKYKIIIPKEEICSFCDGTGQVVSSTTISRFKTCDCKMIPKEEPKQEETLEEVAQRLFDQVKGGITSISAFKKGAKWQQEQDKNKYSDEKEFYKYMAKQDSWKSVGLIIQEFIQLKLKEQDKKLYSEQYIYEKDLYNHKVEISVLALIEIKRAFGALIKDENSYLHKVFMDDYVHQALKELKKKYAEYFDEQIKDW